MWRQDETYKDYTSNPIPTPFFVFLVFYLYHHFSDHDERLVQKAMIGITLLLEDISPSAQQNQILPVSNLAQWVGM